MDSKLMEKAKELASRNYVLSIFHDEELDKQPVFLAKNPELYGCMAQGTTLEDAISNLEDARIDYIYSLLEDGLDVPEPRELTVVTTAESTTAESVQFTLMKTIYVKNAATEPRNSKRLYEASLRL